MKTIKTILLLTTMYFFMSVPSIAGTKDCSHLVKYHKILLCKAGSDKYENEVGTKKKTKKDKGESFNEKYDSLADILKELKGD